MDSAVLVSRADPDLNVSTRVLSSYHERGPDALHVVCLAFRLHYSSPQHPTVLHQEQFDPFPEQAGVHLRAAPLTTVEQWFRDCTELLELVQFTSRNS